MSNIFIFREPRSGSTAFTKWLINRLQRPDIMYVPSRDNIAQILNKENTIIHTHYFQLLDSLHLFEENPILIRTARKNKTEQFLSFHIFKKMVDSTNKNIRKELSQNEVLHSLKPFLIYEYEVIEWVKGFTIQEEYWKNKSSLYKNITIFYEDWNNNKIDIEILNLLDCNISGESEETKLTEDYKLSLVLNYDLVVKWIDKHINNI